jgi:hypothetical protein
MSDKRRYGMGRVYQRGETWWVGYSFNGQEYRESAHSEKEADAIKLLKKKIAEQESGHVIGAGADRITVPQLLDNMIEAMKQKGAKGVGGDTSHAKPIRAAFERTRATALTTKMLRGYITARQGDECAPATINRELEVLRRSYNLAREEERLRHAPYFPMLREKGGDPKKGEHNVREGFFERPEFEAVAANLDDPIDGMARFGLCIGWRYSPIALLTWKLVHRDTREVELPAYLSKNGKPSMIAYDGDPELTAVMDRRWEMRQYDSGISEYVFHRQGRPVVDIRKAWARACRAAELVKPCDSCDGVPATKDAEDWCRRCDGNGTIPSMLFHDLRRTAVRNMIRAGVPEVVAMSISGHKTRSVFDRYNISDTKDRREALRLTSAYRATQPTKRNDENVVPMRGAV